MTVRADLGLRLGTLELDVHLDVDDGEVLVLLGPNGAGKSTVLRALAGLQAVERGRVEIDGRPVDDPGAGVFRPPEDRPVGVVFQDLLLFPHLSVLDNVAFGPRTRGADRAAARAEATSLLERLDLADRAPDRTDSLSGGQAQRVALARALATRPRLLLLDEPLSALDAGVRTDVRRDLRRHLGGFDGATVLVTHDPVDALALADRVVVIERGRVTQEGPIHEVTSRPRTPYVADLLGVNLLRGTGDGHKVTVAQSIGDVDEGAVGAVVTAEAVDGPTLVLIRPASVALHRTRPDTSARNVWSCRVEGFDLLGDHVRVRLSGGLDLVAEVTPAAVADLGLAEGGGVWASVKATEVTVYPA